MNTSDNHRALLARVVRLPLGVNEIGSYVLPPCGEIYAVFTVRIILLVNFRFGTETTGLRQKPYRTGRFSKNSVAIYIWKR
jgi:hypothetical protein